MSAVRMVAYGVLELKEIETNPFHALFTDPPKLETSAQFENDQLRKLVNDELTRYGLLLKRNIVPKNRGWRTKQSEHILLGQLIKPKLLKGQGGFVTREELCVGTFRECCIKAAQVLDALDKTQEIGT